MQSVLLCREEDRRISDNVVHSTECDCIAGLTTPHNSDGPLASDFHQGRTSCSSSSSIPLYEFKHFALQGNRRTDRLAEGAHFYAERTTFKMTCNQGLRGCGSA